MDQPVKPNSNLSENRQDAILWDNELIERYNINGPRYTSYPTALEFNQQYDAERYKATLNAIPKDNKLSLYIHIPFCWHICYYCACNKVITRDYTRVNPYLDALIAEIKTVSKQLKHQVVTQIHWGGGTPTFLNSEDRALLMQTLRKHFNVIDKDKNFECSIEIDPRTVEPDDLNELFDLGFNRLSMGIQDFDPTVQKAVNREQTYEQIDALMQRARQLGINSVSFDLIYGLPHQSTESFTRTLEQVIALRPDRLSVFNYAHLPHRFKPQRRISNNDLPSGDEKLSILHTTIDTMQQAGYVYIGMDHFALPHDELAKAQERGELHRNFQGYTTQHDCDLIGLGVSSISSFLPNDESRGAYIQSTREIADYMKSVKATGLAAQRGVALTRDDQIRKQVIFELICNFGLDTQQVAEQWNINFWEYFSNARDAIEQHIADGLIEFTDTAIKVTPKGRLLVRNVCMLFDRQLMEMGFGSTQQQVSQTFSKAI